MSSASVSQMAWTNGERISLSYFSDKPGLKKALLKMLVIDSATAVGQNKAIINNQQKQQAEHQNKLPQLDIKSNVRVRIPHYFN